MKNIIIIVFLCVVIATGYLVLGNSDVRKYEDPIYVGKTFTWCLMLGRTEGMEYLSSKEMATQIANTTYKRVKEIESGVVVGGDVIYAGTPSPFGDFDLVSYEKYGDTIVSTFGSNDPVLVYSVVMKPGGKVSDWEQIQTTMSRIPFVNMVFKYPLFLKTRWEVTNYYTQSDYANYIEEDDKRFAAEAKMPSQIEKEYNAARYATIDESLGRRYEAEGMVANRQEMHWEKKTLKKQHDSAEKLIREHAYTRSIEEENRQETVLLKKYLLKGKEMKSLQGNTEAVRKYKGAVK